jgi:hypothetical protein
MSFERRRIVERIVTDQQNLVSFSTRKKNSGCNINIGVGFYVIYGLIFMVLMDLGLFSFFLLHGFGPLFFKAITLFFLKAK